MIVLRKVLRIVNGCSGESSTHKITRSQGGIERSLDRNRKGEGARGREKEREGGRRREREGEGERERGRGREREGGRGREGEGEGERVEQALLHVRHCTEPHSNEGLKALHK